jgi:serine/threonine protein kinase
MDRRKEYQPGAMIPGTVYRVVRAIGAGGMGTVYDVEDTTVGKRYVLKTLHAELSSRRDLAKRMQAESRTLARLSHPNIVEVVTAGATSDELRLPYYVMEKLNGQNLRTILSKKGSLDLPHALHIAIDLLDALDNAHDKGVIHRDVKPDNIFLHRNPNGVTTTKLLDFGIMRLLDAGPGVTAGRFMGTLRYAAPEQLRGEALSPQTDLYAAALVLYEMIAGCGPFDDRVDPNKIAAAHIQTQPPPLSSLGMVVPDSLEKLTLAALAKDPSRRPKDAFTFAAQLRALKRALQSDRPGDSVTSRPTDVPVAGLITGVLAPSEIPAASSASPQAFATTEHANTRAPTQEGALPVALAYTVAGMAAPSGTGLTLMNASAVGRTAAPGNVTPDSGAGRLDRNAPTHSIPPEIPLARAEESARSITVSTGAAKTELWRPQHTLRMNAQARARAAGAQHTDRASDLLALLPASESVVSRSDEAASNTLLPGRLPNGRPLMVVVIGVFATGAMTVWLAVWSVHHHADRPEVETTGAGGAAAVAAPATAPFAAPVLAPPLDMDPSPDPSASAAFKRVASAEPSLASATTPSTVAEPPQPLRAHSDSDSVGADPRSDRDHSSPAPSARPAATARPPKRKLPGSGL